MVSADPRPHRVPPVAELKRRLSPAAAPSERASVAADITAALERVDGPGDRAHLLMLRGRAHAYEWESRRGLDDCLEALRLFDGLGEHECAMDAASQAAAFASRMGDLSLAAELATRCIVGRSSLSDPVLASVSNCLGLFCYAFLDFDRAIEQFRAALGAAERCGDRWQVLRQLRNIVDALLVAIREEQASGAGDGRRDRYGRDRLEDAEEAAARLAQMATAEERRQLGLEQLQAELLVAEGRPEEALQVVRGTDPSGALWSVLQFDLALVEARCLRALGYPNEAVAAARRASELSKELDDHFQTVLVLDELVAAEREAGDLDAALRDALDLKRRMWALHRSQTAQLVEQVWTRAALEKERQALEAQSAAAVRSAEEDALTGIGNRRLLERCLDEAAKEHAFLSVLMADIDRFKEINDTFGHDLGDHVLRAMGELWAGDARPGQVAVRYGGEEFVFALPSVELEAARAFAERIRRKVRAHPWEDLEIGRGVTVSIGVAHGPAKDWRAVLAAADRGLYLAKQLGRDRVEISHHAMPRSA